MKLLFAVLFIGCCTLSPGVSQAGQTCDKNGCKLTRDVRPVARVLRTTRESPERVVRIQTTRERVVETTETEDMPRFALTDQAATARTLEDRPRPLRRIFGWLRERGDRPQREVDRSRRVTRRSS